MKAYQIRGQFGLHHLELAELPDPQPAIGEVVVRVRAVSLNYRDFLMVQGLYNPRQKLPLIPCSDGAGEIVAIGPGVTELKVGDRVVSVFASGWQSGEPTRAKVSTTLGGPVDGMLAELRCLPVAAVAPAPTHLDFAEAATLPCAALTAWRALVTEGQTKPGDTILVQGTGGVSIFALQIGKLLGARVIVTSSQDEKLARALQLGAGHGINYRTTPEWQKEARALTGGVGVDHVGEVGGAGTFERSLQAVRMGGRVSCIGVLTGNAGPLSLIPILMQNLRVQGVLVGTRDELIAMMKAFEQHRLKPVVDKIFPFAEVGAAFEHLAAGRHFGKIAIAL